jgi:aminoglycoside phosphotransferase (APT) family kinase protein
LHGDVWTGNVLWHGGRPAFVDWEYARPGDPAEELAYLIEMDALDDGQARALLEAYDVPEVAARVPAWRPLMALSAGLWYAELGVEDRARTLLAQAAAR